MLVPRYSLCFISKFFKKQLKFYNVYNFLIDALQHVGLFLSYIIFLYHYFKLCHIIGFIPKKTLYKILDEHQMAVIKQFDPIEISRRTNRSTT